MWRDPIVEEVRQLREQYAARFNHDLKAICRDLRKRRRPAVERSCHCRPSVLPKWPQRDAGGLGSGHWSFYRGNRCHGLASPIWPEALGGWVRTRCPYAKDRTEGISLEAARAELEL